MKTAIITLLLISLISVIYLFILGKKSASGEAPGLIENRLTKCPETPNCICSEYSDDVDHYIEPLRNAHNVNTSAFKVAVENLGGQVQMQTDTYIAATFASSLFAFVDDVEMRLDPQKGLVHFRSASRVGRSDLGVNQKRVEQIKALLNGAE